MSFHSEADCIVFKINLSNQKRTFWFEKKKKKKSLSLMIFAV